MKVSGIEEAENEEVLDPMYIEQVEVLPMPSLDWDKLEEEDLHARIVPILDRTRAWLKIKKAAEAKRNRASPTDDLN